MFSNDDSTRKVFADSWGYYWYDPHLYDLRLTDIHVLVRNHNARIVLSNASYTADSIARLDCILHQSKILVCRIENKVLCIFHPLLIFGGFSHKVHKYREYHLTPV